MDNSYYLKLRKKAMDLLLADKSKEYYCHIQFVVQIAVGLARQFKVDPKLLEIAGLFHDIGRDKEVGGESHEVTSARMTDRVIQEIAPGLPEREMILRCITHHNNKMPTISIEEKILVTADAASKIIYHQAFMLMCKKEGFYERAEWGIKYLEKGMNNILIIPFREEVTPLYRKCLQIYRAVLDRK